MPSFRAYLAYASVVIYPFGKEDGGCIARAERLEELQYPEELRSHLLEVQSGVHVYDRRELLRYDGLAHLLVHTAAELRQILLPEGEAGGIYMSSEVFEQVGAAFDGCVYVEAVHAARGAGDEIFGAGEHHCGTVEIFHQTGGDYAYDSLVPVRIIDYGRMLQGNVVQAFEHLSALDHRNGFLGSFPVYVLPFVVMPVDFASYPVRRFLVRSGQQLDGDPA